MDIVFRRTGERRYGTDVKRDHFPDLSAAIAPGFHPELPHDVIHFVAEAELGIRKGIFGQLAEGGCAGFEPSLISGLSGRDRKRAERRARAVNRKLRAAGQHDLEWSERAVGILWYEWLARSSIADRRRRAKEVARRTQRVRLACSEEELEALDDNRVELICRRLDELSTQWQPLGVGEGLTVEWPYPERA